MKKPVDMSNQIGGWTTVKGRFDGGRSTLRKHLLNGYEVAVVLERNEDGVLICSSVMFDYPGNKGIPDQSINSSFFQKLRFGEILTEARIAYVQLIKNESDIAAENKVDELLNDWTQLGPSGFPSEKYAAIAWKYEQLVMLGLENPVSLLAEYLRCDKKTAAGRILEARKRDLLTKPIQGNYGGKLTSLGKQLLGIGAKDAKESK